MYQNIGFSLEGPNKVRLTNKYEFTALDEFDYEYEWLQNGELVKSGEVPLVAGDHLDIPAFTGSGELFLNVFAKLKQSTCWAEKGFVISKEQFLVNMAKPESIASEGGSVEVNASPVAIEIMAGLNCFIVDVKSGALTSWKNDGTEILYAPLEPYFWKPANSNQMNNGYNNRLGIWKNAAGERVVEGVDYSVKNGLAVVEVSMSLPVVGAAYQLRYTVNGSGKIQVEAFYKPGKEKIPLMPKFGMRMRLPSSMDYVKWYGRGEFENYPDRKTAALVGCYATDLNSFVTDYAFPQDNANRCDVRWFSLNDKEGRTIKVTGLQPLCFRVWPYGEEDLEKNRHAYELPVRDYVNVNIDLNIHGVGGADSWGARTLDEYTIDGNQAYYYGYLMEYSD